MEPQQPGLNLHKKWIKKVGVIIGCLIVILATLQFAPIESFVRYRWISRIKCSLSGASYLADGGCYLSYADAMKVCRQNSECLSNECWFDNFLNAPRLRNHDTEGFLTGKCLWAKEIVTPVITESQSDIVGPATNTCHIQKAGKLIDGKDTAVYTCER